MLSNSRHIRKQLDHSTHYAGRFGAVFFVTICCERRGVNQLSKTGIANEIFETAKRYHQSNRWVLELLLLMPDHLHALIGISGDTELSKLIRDFKRITAKRADLKWERGFFDHRLRRDESLSENGNYILANPLRANLVAEGEDWPFVLKASDICSDFAPSQPVD